MGTESQHNLTKRVRSLDPTARGGEVTVSGVDGRHGHTLPDLPVGADSTIHGSVELPHPPAKSEAELDEDYLARLANEERESFLLSASALFADGHASSAASVSVSRRLPIVKLSKDGPASFAPGQSIDYGIGATNAGSSVANVSVTDMVDGQPVAPVAGFSVIGPGESAAGVHSVAVPSSFLDHGLHDRATVSWKDEAGNAYGPVSADFTSIRQATSVLPAPTITDGPPEKTPDSTAVFAFIGVEGVPTECRIDNDGWMPCSSPIELDEVIAGNHRFAVRHVSTVHGGSESALFEWIYDPSAGRCYSADRVPEVLSSSRLAGLRWRG